MSLHRSSFCKIKSRPCFFARSTPRLHRTCAARRGPRAKPGCDSGAETQARSRSEERCLPLEKMPPKASNQGHGPDTRHPRAPAGRPCQSPCVALRLPLLDSLPLARVGPHENTLPQSPRARRGRITPTTATCRPTRAPWQLLQRPGARTSRASGTDFGSTRPAHQRTPYLTQITRPGLSIHLPPLAARVR